ncbi:hypothetical protein EJ04DRAFT_538331 [Polyplosphaeria fusca]|uniref:LisH domain-containing protein n=1 Tax=Polyplosphaeria fusca TaxID=682080 RepID=A0A9P4QLK2_9PLEO|nr:hypothetical protein EJ04DRAFT_538331 [Polyplosphaeria fusca]
MTVETLSSNVVNYLVWRYLQEAGYGNAALQLSRCWMRDPESLPFAKNVPHYALVDVLQDGIQLDKYRAEAGGGARRHDFGRDHGRPYSARNGDMLTLDRGIPAHQLAEEANANGLVPEPAPRKASGKRKKKVNGVEPRMNTHVNGDAMDIDQNGSAHVANSVRAESEAAVSEADSPLLDVDMSTLRLGLSTEMQTEKPIQVVNLAPRTSFECSFRGSSDQANGPSVRQTIWGTRESPLLLAAGESMLRLYYIPSSNGDYSTLGPKVHDLTLPHTQFSVTAVCWISITDMIVSTRGELKNESGETMKIHNLLKLINGGSECKLISSTAGFVTTLRWNDAKTMLLSISTDGNKKGFIKIWTEMDDSMPTYTASTDHVIYDAAWVSESTFVVTGEGLFQTYEVSDSLAVRCNFPTSTAWDTIRVDPRSGIVAATGMDMDRNQVILGIVHPSNQTELQTHDYPDPHATQKLEFQPRSDPDSYTAESQVLVATCSQLGVTRVWDANQPFKCLHVLPTVDKSEAHAIAFSDDGVLLAAGGPDAVTVWNLEQSKEPMATWRAEDQSNANWNPYLDAEYNISFEPGSWRLSSIYGDQIAIIDVPR